jgi:hypothetical protein
LGSESSLDLATFFSFAGQPSTTRLGHGQAMVGLSLFRLATVVCLLPSVSNVPPTPLPFMVQVGPRAGRRTVTSTCPGCPRSRGEPNSCSPPSVSQPLHMIDIYFVQGPRSTHPPSRPRRDWWVSRVSRVSGIFHEMIMRVGECCNQMTQRIENRNNTR